MLQSVLAALAALFLSPIGDDCPDQVVSPVDTRISQGQDLGCGGVQADLNGLQIDTRGRCPSFILITPAHMTTKHDAGSNTFTLPAGQVEMTLLTYSCEKSYFIFIPVGSRCQLVRQSVIGRVTTYAQYPCGEPRDPKADA